MSHIFFFVICQIRKNESVFFCYYSLTGPRKDISQDSNDLSPMSNVYHPYFVQSATHMPTSNSSLELSSSSSLPIDHRPQLLLRKIYLENLHIHPKMLCTRLGCVFISIYFYWILFFIYMCSFAFLSIKCIFFGLFLSLFFSVCLISITLYS